MGLPDLPSQSNRRVGTFWRGVAVAGRAGFVRDETRNSPRRGESVCLVWRFGRLFRDEGTKSAWATGGRGLSWGGPLRFEPTTDQSVQGRPPPAVNRQVGKLRKATMTHNLHVGHTRLWKYDFGHAWYAANTWKIDEEYTHRGGQKPPRKGRGERSTRSSDRLPAPCGSRFLCPIQSSGLGPESDRFRPRSIRQSQRELRPSGSPGCCSGCPAHSCSGSRTGSSCRCCSSFRPD